MKQVVPYIFSPEIEMAPRGLRVRAVGGRNLAHKGGLMGMLERKPDVFVALVVGTEAKSLAVLKHANVKEFTWGADAVADFSWPSGDAVEIQVHVKDKDTAKERYIGGAKMMLQLADVHAETTKTINLEYNDEKLKTKKGQGQVTLTFERIEDPTEAKAKANETSNETHPPMKSTEAVANESEPAPREAAAESNVNHATGTGTPSSENAPAAMAPPRKRGKQILIIQAIGGSNLAPKTGAAHMMDPDPDPYLIVHVGGLSHTYPELDNVKTKEFKWGHNAIHEFAVDGDAVDVLVHCKDKDLMLDTYVGGAKFKVDLTRDEDRRSWDETIELEYAATDMKTKSKTSRGKIQLGFVLTDVSKPAEKSAKTTGKEPMDTKKNGEGSKDVPKTTPIATEPAKQKEVPEVEKATLEAAKPDKQRIASDTPIVKEEGNKTPNTTTETAVSQDEKPVKGAIDGPPQGKSEKPFVNPAAAADEKTASTTAKTKKTATENTTTPQDEKPLQGATPQGKSEKKLAVDDKPVAAAADEKTAAKPPTDTAKPVDKATAAPVVGTSQPNDAKTASPVSKLVVLKRKLKVQAVGGRNLAPKTGASRFVDPNPDPYLVIQLGKLTQTYPVLDDVKTKEFEWGADAVHDFDLPLDTNDPITLAIHCKDKDLVLDHYIGGATVTLQWNDFDAAKSLLRRTVPLEYADPSFETKAPASRGDVVLSFFLVEELKQETVPPLKQLSLSPTKATSPRKATLSARLYKGNLLLIAHSAKGLTVVAPKKKSAPEKRADPYVVFQLGLDRVACPEAKDGHATPKWPDARHTFAVDTTVHGYVDVLVYDKSGDRFMGAARLRLVDCLATLTNHIQATMTVPLACDEAMAPASTSAGDVQLSLLFTPWDANQVMWKGAAVGHLILNSFAVANNVDWIGGPNKDLYVEVTIRRTATSAVGYLVFRTSVKVNAAGGAKITWEDDDDAFVIPYALFLHVKMMRDKCPTVVFALKDKNEIVQEKTIAHNATSLLDLLGLNGPKQVMLLHAKSPGRLALDMTLATALPPPNPETSFASSPGTLRLFVLGADTLTSVLPWQNVQATISGKAWGRGDCATDAVDATSDGLVVWNSAFEAQYLPVHVKAADAYVVTLDVSIGGKSVGVVEVAVLARMEQHHAREFVAAVQKDGVVVCNVTLALGFVPLAPKEMVVSPRTSCVDFGAGTLHLVVFKAEQLVPDKDVPVDEIDPEVRISLKPRPAKQKDSKSSAKTRPLEHAGPNPVWNEYLRVDYMPSKDPTTPQISPMVCVSINDIQMPGETREMNVVGTTELPLASFVATTPDCKLFSTKLTLERANKPTGFVYLCGIFESKTAPEPIWRGCAAAGHKLRLSTPSMGDHFDDSSYFPGRLEIHVGQAKDLNQNPTLPFRCELCLSSDVDERARLTSRQTLATNTEVVWDNQVTLFTQTAKADFLRVDLFQEHTLVGWAKIPLSTYCQEPRKAFREYHDIVLTSKDTAVIKPRILLELTFFTDQTLQTFTQQSPTDQGTLYVTLNTIDSRTPVLSNKKLSLRVTLVNVSAGDAAKQTAVFPFQVLAHAKTTWNQTVALLCPADFTAQTAKAGTCPLLRYELLDGTTAFGKDAISRDDIAISALLATPRAVLHKRLPNSTIATDKAAIAFSKLRLVYVPAGDPPLAVAMDTGDAFLNQFEDALPPVRGTLSMRVIAGRNLTDVDVYGDQDPYVTLQVEPPTYQLPDGCVLHAQTGVCLNSGRHPVWNSPVYALTVHDANVELVTMRVLDSGEEEHVPDTLIGGCQSSVFALLKMTEADPKRWSEGWFRVFNDAVFAGDVRVEFRFVAESAARVAFEPPTKYINCHGGRGRMVAKVVSGTKLPCTSGMFPAVRVFVESTKFAYVTQPEKRAITTPSWNEQVEFEIEWTPDHATLVAVRVEVVDLGAGVSSSLPIVAHCHINVAPFVIHPHEIHCGIYPLMTFQSKKTSTSTSTSDDNIPALTLAFQFLPADSKVEPFDEPLAVVPDAGQIHVKILEGAFRTDAAFRPFVECRLRHSLGTAHVKQIKPCVSELDDYALCVWNESLLFDLVESPSSSSTPDLPTLDLAVCNQDDPTTPLGELIHLPLFPFVLSKGHLNIAWYPLYHGHTFVAQVKVEIQFLKCSPVPKAVLNDVLSIEVIDGRGLVLAQDAEEAQDPYVTLAFLTQTVQTKAHVDGGTEPVWHETFELPLVGLDHTSLPVLAIQVLNADIKKRGDGLIGTCNWIVPKEVLYDGKLRDVVLKLNASNGVICGEIQIRLKRGQMKSMVFGDAVDVLHPTPSSAMMQAGEATGESINLAGLLYLFGRPMPCSIQVRAMLTTPASSSSSEGYSPPFALPEMAVLGVPSSDEPLKRHVPHPQTHLKVEVLPSGKKSNQNGTAVVRLAPDELQAVFRTPHKEFRFPMAGSNEVNNPTTGDLSLVYVKPTQGLFNVTVDRIDALPVVAKSQYYVEMRVLRNSPWVKTPSTRGPKAATSSSLEWKRYAARELQYTNFREHVPPQLQLVVYAQDANQSAAAASAPTKVAFAQLNLLQYIVAAGAVFDDETVPLTCVSPHALGETTARLTIVYAAIEATAESPQDAVAKALQLAEGTAEMKKSFLNMGGDESTPLDIAAIQAYAESNEACMHMLTRAAEAVGGLDALFEAMDSNKDGKISWEEYLDRMQTIHALADEATTKPAHVQVQTHDDDGVSDDGDDEDDVIKADDKGNDDDDDDGKAPSKPQLTYTQQPRKPTPPMPSRSYLDDIKDDETETPFTAQPKPGTRNPAISPMVALPKAIEEATRATQSSGAKSSEDATSQRVVLVRRGKGPDEATVTTWKVADVAQWLECDIELPQYIPAFVEASVDGSLLLTLTPEDLEATLPIPQPLHRRKLLGRIQQLQKQVAATTIAAQAEKPMTTTANTDTVQQLQQTKPPQPRKKPPAAVVKANAVPVDLNEKGLHEIERSKLAFKAQAKTKQQKAAVAETDVATKHWGFAYTGEGKPEAAQSAIEKVAAILRVDEAKSAYDGAMEHVLAQVAPPVARIQIPLIANTDEVVEVVKQAIWKYGQALVQQREVKRAVDHDATSDFGDDDDDAQDDLLHRQSLIELVFAELCALKNNGARWLNETAKLSRLKLQGGLQALLGITMSWHQFDLLYRRLDACNDGEITWKAFHAAFGDPVPGTAMSNDMLAVKEGLVLMIERLEEHELTLTQAWQAFDRDNSGAISLAEFSTLIKFLTHQEGAGNLTKHQIYLMMAALDTSCDRLIQHAEFMKFIFVVWSHRLMQLQQYLYRKEAADEDDGKQQEWTERVVARKVALRKALRKNFSRPFRDAMRCTPVAIPGPFQGLLEKFHLQPPSTETQIQIWQVLKGETGSEHGAARVGEMKVPHKKHKPKATGQNTLVKTKLTRGKQPERENCVLRAPVQVNLDAAQELIYDKKTHKISTGGNLHRVRRDF
ncbi:Aste57867_9112 [Aphanomyces stellatus]|uniref:Aste57867_9112 protein n=1 Tax=Aphanomyces stellatus TaxID=120398 RepID=A0A485KM86_9STRA|nr:hypothetical protein As57867_009076 [Aphanomyces stellatus]VFT85996.1 Aste57867_9112 [Aphanomyces stellatus]